MYARNICTCTSTAWCSMHALLLAGIANIQVIKYITIYPSLLTRLKLNKFILAK